VHLPSALPEALWESLRQTKNDAVYLLNPSLHLMLTSSRYTRCLSSPANIHRNSGVIVAIPCSIVVIAPQFKGARANVRSEDYVVSSNGRYWPTAAGLANRPVSTPSGQCEWRLSRR